MGPASAAGQVSQRQMGPQIRSEACSRVHPGGQLAGSTPQAIGRATQWPESHSSHGRQSARSLQAQAPVEQSRWHVPTPTV